MGKSEIPTGDWFFIEFFCEVLQPSGNFTTSAFWFVRNRLLERAGQDASNGCDHIKRRTRPSNILQLIMYPSFTDDLPHRPMPSVFDPEYRGRYPEMVLIPFSPCFLHIFFKPILLPRITKFNNHIDIFSLSLYWSSNVYTFLNDSGE